MHGLALVAIGLMMSPSGQICWAAADGDVGLYSVGRYRVPFVAGPEKLDSCKLFVSSDRGMNWQLVATVRADQADFPFSVQKPGIYWIAMQTVTKDGRIEPPRVEALMPAQKMLMLPKAAQRRVVPERANEKLSKDLQELRTAVDRMQKRIAEIEKKLDPK